jgi:hypothetical protein
MVVMSLVVLRHKHQAAGLMKSTRPHSKLKPASLQAKLNSASLQAKLNSASPQAKL